MNNCKIGLIGCGAMGSALIEGFTKLIPGENIFLYNIHTEKAQKLADKIGAQIVGNSTELLTKHCDFIILAVKPYIVKSAIDDLFENYTANYNGTIVSVAAGVKLSDLQDCLRSCRQSSHIVRLMPNTACLVGEGMTGLCSDDYVPEETIEKLMQLVKTTGLVERVTEKMLDAVTALCGSGIAYGYMFIEALADAGVQFGMKRAQAYTYAGQMLVGAGKMVLETGEHPGKLKDDVCSPGGITIKALQTLEDRAFRGTVIAAAKTAFDVSTKMGKR